MLPFPKNRQTAAITWVELLALVAIAAVLIGLYLPQLYSRHPVDRRTNAIVLVQTISVAVRAYYNDYGHYPKVSEPRSPDDTGVAR